MTSLLSQLPRAGDKALQDPALRSWRSWRGHRGNFPAAATPAAQSRPPPPCYPNPDANFRTSKHKSTDDDGVYAYCPHHSNPINYRYLQTHDSHEHMDPRKTPT